MKINFRKAGLLILTLVIPALVFVFLKFFARNHYDLPYYFPLTDANGATKMYQGDTVFYKVPDLRIRLAGGAMIDPGLWERKISVVSYLPENCSDSCQLVLSQLDRVAGMEEVIGGLQVITLTDKWDGKKDFYPESLNTNKWLLGVGTKSEIDSTLNLVLRIQTNVPKVKTNSIETKLILVDGNAHIRGYYNAANAEEVDRLMAEIRILDYEKKSK